MAWAKANMMNDQIKDAAKQMDDWAARQAESGFSGSVRMMGQSGTEVTPVYERKIGTASSSQAEKNARDVERAALRWFHAKVEFEAAARELEAAVREQRGY
jgi:hypothetical protein